LAGSVASEDGLELNRLGVGNLVAQELADLGRITQGLAHGALR